MVNGFSILDKDGKTRFKSNFLQKKIQDLKKK